MKLQSEPEQLFQHSDVHLDRRQNLSRGSMEHRACSLGEGAFKRGEKEEKEEEEEKREEEEELYKFMRDCLRLAFRWKPSSGSAAAGQMLAFQTEHHSPLTPRIEARD